MKMWEDKKKTSTLSEQIYQYARDLLKNYRDKLLINGIRISGVH